jgi:hypothetical protein
MSGKVINPLEMKPSEVREAIDQLPDSIRVKISGIIKQPEPVQEDQSPEAIRKANLRDLKAKRKSIIASLIEIEKEIYHTEEVTLAQEFDPQVRRDLIMNALRGTADFLGRRSFLLSEVRELYPHPEIAFESWMSELRALKQDGILSFTDSGHIMVLKKMGEEAI